MLAFWGWGQVTGLATAYCSVSLPSETFGLLLRHAGNVSHSQMCLNKRIDLNGSLVHPFRFIHSFISPKNLKLELCLADSLQILTWPFLSLNVIYHLYWNRCDCSLCFVPFLHPWSHVFTVFPWTHTYSIHVSPTLDHNLNFDLLHLPWNINITGHTWPSNQLSFNCENLKIDIYSFSSF